jgi:hypothetical protein
MLPRRRMLLTSATLPLLLAAAGCRSSDVFAGPDPLAGRPPPSHDVVTLQAVITAEQNLIHLYQAAINGGSGIKRSPDLLRPLLAEHEQHLARLKARLVLPPGQKGPVAGRPAGGRPPEVSALVAAERASAAGLVRRLASVPPDLAQLFASIAASDATHAAVLGGSG